MEPTAIQLHGFLIDFGILALCHCRAAYITQGQTPNDLRRLNFTRKSRLICANLFMLVQA